MYLTSRDKPHMKLLGRIPEILIEAPVPAGERCEVEVGFAADLDESDQVAWVSDWVLPWSEGLGN